MTIKGSESQVAQAEKTERRCPLCKYYYSEYPAISRFDNKTEICPECGEIEAMTMFLQPGFKGFDPNSKPKVGKHGKVVDFRQTAYHDITVYEDGYEDWFYIGD